MRTQSMDTSPEAERFLITLLHQRGAAKRFHLAASMSYSAKVAALLAFQQEKPGLDEQEALFHAEELSWGSSLVAELRQVAEQRQIWPEFSTISLEAAFIPILQALEQMGITCALTGSLARSIYGMQRTHLQVDIVARLEHVDAVFLQKLLPAAFYARPADIQAAVAEKTSFIYYHLPSLFSIQVSFPRVHLDEATMLTRTHHLTLLEGEPALLVLAPEDIVVLTLEEIQKAQTEIWRKRRKEEPDDLWNELLGVLKVQGQDLDLQFIERQAHRFDLLNSMRHAFEDAGL
ncbi:MAG TPA: hypothetical protein VGM01_08910 [Ktedonobacteraceae bacterium]